MPYTQEELESLEYYQNLIDIDEQQYLQAKAALLAQSATSGSADDGALLSRDETGAILLFENPYTNALVEDPSSKVIHSTLVKLLNTTESNTINEILDREFEEL